MSILGKVFVGLVIVGLVYLLLLGLNAGGLIDLGGRSSASGNTTSARCGLEQCHCCKDPDGGLYYDCNEDCFSKSGTKSNECEGKVLDAKCLTNNNI